MIQVTVNGEDVTKYVKVNSFRILDAVNNRSTCEFTFLDADNNRSYAKGIPVQVTGDDGMLFSGFIDSATYTKLGKGRNIGIKCVDMHYLGDKRVIAKSYKTVAAGAVVRDILQQKLKDEGVRGFDMIKEFNHAVDWQTGAIVGAIPTDAGVALAKYGVDLTRLFTATADFDAGTKTNIDSSGNQIVMTKEGSTFTKVWTVTADFAGGTNTTNASNQLQLNVNGTAISDTDNNAATLGTGTLSLTTAANNDLRLVNIYYDSGDSISGWTNAAWSSNSGALYCSNANGDYAYRNIGIAPNMNIEYDAYVPNNGIINMCFLCNSNANGQFFRLDSRSGSKCGYYTLNGGSWSSGWAWAGASYEGWQIGGNAWHHVRLVIGATTVQAYVDGTAAGAAYPFTNYGGYVNLINEVTGGGQVDNIVLYPNYGYRIYSISVTGCGTPVSSSISWTVGSAPTGSWTQVYTSFDCSSWVVQSTSGGAVNGVNGVNMSGKTLYVLMQVGSSYANTPTFSSINVTITPPLFTSGSWQSSAQSLSSVAYALNSTLAWNCNIPAGCGLTFQTSIDGGTSWQTVTTSGNAIGNVTLRMNVSSTNLLVKISLTGTTTATPTVYDVTATVNTSYKTTATWLSPAVALDTLVEYGAGTITWSNPSVPANTTLTVYASTDNISWTSITASGQSVPNFAVLDSMTGKSLWFKVNMTSDGSVTPTFYDIQASITSAYNTHATWDYSVDLSDVGLSDDTVCTYTTSAVVGHSTVTVSASIDNTNWTVVSNSGDPIPTIPDGELVGTTLYVHVDITTDGVSTANISYLKLEIYNTSIQDGITLDEAVFNYCTCSRAIDRLSQRCGFWWCISANRVLYFMPVDQIQSGWGTLTIDDVRNSSVSVVNGNAKYVNTQYVKGAYDITAQQSQTLTCDGKTTSWALAYPLNSEPVVKIGGTTQTVGVKGTGATQKFYWQKSDPVIYYNGAATDLPTGTTLTVTFYGEFPIVVMSSDSAEIYGRQTVEGVGSGVVEGVTEDQSLNTRDASYQLAANLLGTNGKIGNTVTVDTYYRGLYAGEYITVQLPKYNIDESDMLIQQVETTISSGRVKYKATITENHPDDWTNMFRTLADKSLSIRENISENEVLVQTFSQGDTWAWTDSFTNTSVPTVYPSDTTYPSDTIYPSG